MKIALVNCPIKHKLFSENLKTVDEEFCVAPPISLAYVAAIIERAGHTVTIIDAHALKLSKRDTLKRLRYFQPDVLGFRVDTYQFHTTLDWIRFLKKALQIPVMVGGINLLLYPRETLSYAEIDFGIIGEALESLPQLLTAIDRGEELDAIEGIIYKKNGHIKVNSFIPKPINYDSYPFPARHLLPNDKYHSFISQKKNFTIMVTSKGCPYRCKFCAIAMLPYVERSPRSVVDEIEDCYKHYEVREIDFFDAVFFLNKRRALDICNEIIRRNISIEWTCRSRVDVVDDELLATAAKAGCRCIYYGIESSVQDILKRINKEVDVKQIKQAIQTTRKYGIQTLGFFMIGNPGEDNNTIEETIRFSKELDLDFVQVCTAIAKPGTDYARMLKDASGRDYWQEYIAGKAKEHPLPAPWTHLSYEENRKYIKKAYCAFYFRPSYILKRIRNAQSFDEFKRYIRVGIKMLACKK